MMRPRSLLMPSLLGAVALLLVVLTCLLWQRMCSIDQIPRRTAESGKEASTSAQRPKDDVEFVEFPGIGQVKGRAVHRKLEAADEEGVVRATATPEKLVLDADGNFLYLRNRVPVFKSKRRFDLVEKFYRKYFEEILSSTSVERPKYGVESFRILGPASFDLADAAIRNQIIVLGRDLGMDIEIWAVKVFSPWDAERNMLLVASTTGTVEPSNWRRYESFIWNKGMLREWSLLPAEGSEQSHASGTLKIMEEWEEVPAGATDGATEHFWGFIFEGEKISDEAIYEERKRALEAEKQGK